MNSSLSILQEHLGSFEGWGVNHEGQKFRGTLTLSRPIEGKGVSLDFVAVGDDGTVYHQEHSLLGLSTSGALSLWVMSSNHPGVIEHVHFHDDIEAQKSPGATHTLSFRAGDLRDVRSFREVISIDFWPGGDVSYRYSWGMPGEEFQERSAVRMSAGKNREIPEARLKSTANGLVPEGEGWYILNAQEARWKKNEKFGEFCGFEGDQRFPQYGINLHRIHPGQPNCHYHGEDDQEDFLVVRGRCKVLIEGQERELKQWDFVHCPKWTKHVFVGMGSETCTLVMMGGRTGHGVIYPVVPLVRRYDACPEQETDSPKTSYVHVPENTEIPAPNF